MDQLHRSQFADVPEPNGEPAFAHGSTCYTVKSAFSNAVVLVTGGTGYIGSLVVEQLLRTVPDVAKIYLIIRSKGGNPAKARLERLLNSGLFHMVRDDLVLRSKVEVIEGDIDCEDLGLASDDFKKLLGQVNFIIHSAASIGLEVDVQRSLRSNYLGTQHLLSLASQMHNLRCFLHLSTAYVNVNFPKGSTVDEVIYPLKIGRQDADHQAIVDDLMSLDPSSANTRAQMYLDMWDFPNTYTLGKNLTEKLVASYHRQGMPVAIVRPSLVCGLAGDPYPGYCGNLAGPVGMGVAIAIGLFSGLGSVAMVPTHVWDAVPGDVVSSVVLAAAAATAAGVKINGYVSERPESEDDPMIIHAGTSTTYPISMIEAAYATYDFIFQNPAPYKLPGSRPFRIPIDYVPDESKVKKAKFWTAKKVWAATHFLDWIGQHKTAHRLKYGYLAWEVMNSAKTDKNMFFSSRNLLELEERLDATDAAFGDYKITWTSKNGGWLRYIATNMAGMYRNVFGISEVKGLRENDFKFIPNKPTAKVTGAEVSQQQVDVAAAVSPNKSHRTVLGCLPLRTFRQRTFPSTAQPSPPAHESSEGSPTSSATSFSAEALAVPLRSAKLAATESRLVTPVAAGALPAATAHGTVVYSEPVTTVQQARCEQSLPAGLKYTQLKVRGRAPGA